MWLPLKLAAVTCWAAVNVFDSLLVRHYVKHPIVLGWSQSCFSILFLVVLVLFWDIQTSWAFLLALVGIVAFLGDVVSWKALDHIDVSVTNIAWVTLSVFLSIGGFFLFAEAWSLPQAAGSVLVLAGIAVLSVWHRTVDNPRSLLLLPLVAALNVPFYLLQKAALLSGAQAVPVFFWSVFGREMAFFLLPCFVPRFRREITSFVSRSDWRFHGINAVVVSFFFAGVLLTTKALAVGPVSLISIVGDVQPFLVLLFAWILWKMVPSHAPRELLTAQSVQVKLMSFAVVFVGLGLLAM